MKHAASSDAKLEKPVANLCAKMLKIHGAYSDMSPHLILCVLRERLWGCGKRDGGIECSTERLRKGGEEY